MTSVRTKKSASFRRDIQALDTKDIRTFLQERAADAYRKLFERRRKSDSSPPSN